MECILRLQLRQVSFEQTRWAKDQDLTSQKKVGMTLEKRWKNVGMMLEKRWNDVGKTLE